jgi:transcriptional regulator with XRE-family HTH domain
MSNGRVSAPTLCCMAGNTGTARDRGLGAELRQAREQAKIGLRKLAGRLGWDPSRLSRIETGERSAKPEDVAAILVALDAALELRERLVAWAAEPNGHSWSPITIPEQQQHLSAYLEFERTAKKITEVVLGVIPGLLQTPDYARAIISRESAPPDVEQRVAIRLGRREVLQRAEPLELVAVIGEPALDSNVGGDAVMVDQLRHLQKMSASVDIRVIPTRSDWHPAMVNNFALFEFAAASPIVHIETRWSGLYLHEEADVDLHRDAVERVLAAALSPQLSAETVARKLADRMENR